jgi:subtilisin family serine protease
MLDFQCDKVYSLNMKFKVAISVLSLLLLANEVRSGTQSKMIKVAVIDTGLDLQDPRFKKHLCKTGHKNFVTRQPIRDLQGHGTFIAGLIQKYAGHANYCLLIYKYYDDKDPGIENVNREVRAIKEAVANGATVVNFSAGGPEASKYERLAISGNPQVTFVVAAGNEGQDLDEEENEFFPASYRLGNIIPVGNVDRDGKRATMSNYASFITAKEMGMDIESYLPNGRIGRMSGTSISAAIHTGKLVDRM